MSTSTTTTLAELSSFKGKELGTSDWFEITQERVNTFADATDDHQWIHVDVERAKAESPFRGPIGHGFLTPIFIVTLDDTLPRADRPNPADAEPPVADHVLFDDEPLLAVLSFDDPRRPVAKRRVDVFVPQIQWLEDVSVRIDDIVSATHNPAPFG